VTSQQRRWTAVICLAALLLVVAWVGLRVIPMWQAGQALRADLAAAEALLGDDLQTLYPEEALQLVHATRSDLLALQSAARPFLWLAPHLGWVPGCGPEVEAAPALLQIGLHLTAAGEELLEPLSPLLERAGGEEITNTVDLQQATAVLKTAQPQLRRAQSEIRKAQAARETLNAERLDSHLQSWLLRLDQYVPPLQQSIVGALLAPELLGADGARTYLLLIQNEDELRATGGFISAVAQARVENGQVRLLEFEDSYAVDDFSQPYPEPPEPLWKYMQADLWVFRDSNWSPDFPTSARKAIELYAISREVELDGVIALDQEAIRLLVGAVGPLQVDGSPQPVTRDNVIPLARQAWSPEGTADSEWWQHRKDFVGLVIDAAMRRAQGGVDRAGLLRLGQAAYRALRQKHLLVYLSDEDAAPLLTKANWDGALQQVSGDYLMVVDTNMGFNKANGLVKERLTYTVDLTDRNLPHAALVVHHEHPLTGWRGPCDHKPRYDRTYRQMMERCYWDYLRVYVPSAAELSGATPHAVSADVLLSGTPSPAEVMVQDTQTGHRVLETFLLLRPGEMLDTRFEYALPKGTLRCEGTTCEYSLTVQKQPGTQAVPLHVQILMPSGASVSQSDPEPDTTPELALQYTLALQTDQQIAVTFEGSGR
jgi:hypothetical protein